MTTITTRAGKGSPLTNTELDNNFTNLNTAKYESGNSVSLGSGTFSGLVTVKNTNYATGALRISRNLDTAVYGAVAVKQVFGSIHNGADVYPVEVVGGVDNDGTALYYQVLLDSTDKFKISPSSVVFNESSADTDFRVESDANANMLYVDATNDAVGIGGVPITSSQLTAVAAADTNIVLKSNNNYMTLVQDAAWNSVILGGAYWSGQAKHGVTGRSVARLYLGHDNDATPTSQGLLVHASASGTVNDNVTFEHLFSTTRGGTFFNDDGLDRDFRVESDSNANMLFVDAAANTVSVGGTGGWGTLQVIGATNSEYRTFFVSESTDASKGVGIAYDQTNDRGVIAAVDGGTGWKNVAISPSGGYVSVGLPANQSIIAPLHVEGGSVMAGGWIRTLHLQANFPVITFQSEYSTDSYGGIGYDSSNKNMDFWVGATGSDVTSSGNRLFRLRGTDGVIVNEDSQNMDFRVESDANSNMLFVDASSSEVGIGTGDPTKTLDVAGEVLVRKAARIPSLVTTSYTGDTDAHDSGGAIQHTIQHYYIAAPTAQQYRHIATLPPASGVTGEKLKIRVFISALQESDYYEYDIVMGQRNNFAAMLFNSQGTSNSYRTVAGIKCYQQTDGSTDVYMWTASGTGYYYGFTAECWADGFAQTADLISPADVVTVNSVPSGTLVFDSTDDTYHKTRFYVAEGAIVANDGSQDVDFRVESDGNTHALFVDASTDKVSVGMSATRQRLNVNGAVEAGTSTSVGGGVALYHTYTGDSNYIANWGAKYSSGGPAMNYGGYWSTQPSSGFYSTYANFTGSHASLIVDGANLRFYADSSDSNAGVDGVVSLVEYFTTGRAGTVVNEQSANHDFRVESDANTHMLFVDAGAGHVNVGTSSDLGSTFNVNGTSRFTSRVSIGDVNYVYGGSNYHIALLENSNDAYIGNIEGGGYMSGGGFYYGGGAWQLTGSATAISSVWTDPDGTVRFYNSSGGTSGSQISGYERMRVAPAEVVVNEISRADTDFRVESDAHTHAFWVDASTGQVFFGATTESGLWNGSSVNQGVVIGAANDPYLTIQRTAGGNIYSAKSSAATDHRHISFLDGGSEVGRIESVTGGVVYNTTSDVRLKENIEAITDGTEKLMAMRPVTHTWIADKAAPAVHGFIAQEMIDIVPEAVSGDPTGEEMMSMDYGRITPVLVAALQDAHKKIAELEARLNTLEGK